MRAGRCIDFNLLEFMLLEYTEADNVKIDAVVVFQRSFPSQIQRIQIVAR